jgi:hypothetical protein
MSADVNGVPVDSKEQSLEAVAAFKCASEIWRGMRLRAMRATVSQAATAQ